MKTIAITMDEETLTRLEELERRKGMNRSEMVREAVRMYVDEEDQIREEERERRVFRRLKNKLGKQTAAMIREQAKP